MTKADYAELGMRTPDDFDPAACPTCGEEDFDGCDGCGSCQDCCNCTPSDCDCSACQIRRENADA